MLLSANEQHRNWIASHVFLLGDVHNHCGISYGHGSVNHAIGFACQQLDFFSITGHFAWPDMTTNPERSLPSDVAQYHREGFAKLRQQWDAYRNSMKQVEADYPIIPFLSYEYHHFLYGDYTVVEKSLDTDLPPLPNQHKEDLRLKKLLDQDGAHLDSRIPIPHHIGYKEGFRGISWDNFNDKASPLVEIISLHGCAESHHAPYPYLHTMGPRWGQNTMQGGLAKGHRFGVMGNTDHHNASPGSYGCGRTGLWASQANRHVIWDALLNRQSIALSGDPIEIALFVDDNPIGSMLESIGSSHRITTYVAGCDVLEKVELVVNDTVVARRFPIDAIHQHSEDSSLHGRVSLEFGWGKKQLPCLWDIDIDIENGVLVEAVPRLRGNDIVAPKDLNETSISSDEFYPTFSNDNGKIHLRFLTNGNPNTVTNANQGCSLEVSGTDETVIRITIHADWNGKPLAKIFNFTLKDIVDHPNSEYLDGFVSPAISIGQYVPIKACTAYFDETLVLKTDSFVYVRVFQGNGDCAFSSPIWV